MTSKRKVQNSSTASAGADVYANSSPYITSLEAAQVLSLTKETVRSYVKRGILDGRATTSGCTVLISSVEEYIQANRTSVEEKQQAVDLLEKELDERRDELKRTLRAMKRDARELELQYEEHDLMCGLFKSRHKLAEVINACICILEEDRKSGERMGDILRMVISGYSYEYIGKKYGITAERVRIIYFKGMRRIARMDNYTELLMENERLKAKEEEYINREKALLKEIEKLREYIEGYRGKLANDPLQEVSVEDFGTMVSKSLLGKKISDPLLGINVRTLNVLRSLDVNTVYDLVMISRDALTNTRSAGRKTCTLIEDFLEDRGLRLGMNNHEVVNWLLNHDCGPRNELGIRP